MRSCSPGGWDVAAPARQEGLKERGYNRGRDWARGQVSSAFQERARQQIACAVANWLSISICYLLSACLSVWWHVIGAGLSNFGP